MVARRSDWWPLVRADDRDPCYVHRQSLCYNEPYRMLLHMNKGEGNSVTLQIPGVCARTTITPTNPDDEPDVDALYQTTKLRWFAWMAYALDLMPHMPDRAVQRLAIVAPTPEARRDLSTVARLVRQNKRSAAKIRCMMVADSYLSQRRIVHEPE